MVENVIQVARLGPSSDGSSQPCDWLHFAARTGEEGRSWAVQYQQYAPVVEISNEALELLRHRQLDEGQAKLQEFIHVVKSLDTLTYSMRAVMDRWYQGIVAFYFYCIEDFDRADEAMLLAHQAVVEAISESGFLIMLSVHCQEFCLHQARICRNRGLWQEMERYIERARAMVMDHAPLCETKDGHDIFFSTLCRFFDSLQPLNAREQHAIRALVKEEERIQSFNNFVRRLVRLPDFAISYP